MPRCSQPWRRWLRTNHTSHQTFPKLCSSSFLAKPGQPQSSLTPRERGVVQLVAEGHSNKQVANVLNVSIKTVETHRAAVMRKLNMSSTASLVRYAIRNRLVEP